jgi:hypothetical protein
MDLKFVSADPGQAPGSKRDTMFVHDRAKLCKRTLTAVMPGHPQTLYKRFRDSCTFPKLQRLRMGAAGNCFVWGGTTDVLIGEVIPARPLPPRRSGEKSTAYPPDCLASFATASTRPSLRKRKKREFRAIPCAFSPPLKPNINGLGAVSSCRFVTGMSGDAFAMPIGLRLPRGSATLHL